jgi:uncharacterized protein (DUF433 family)
MAVPAIEIPIRTDEHGTIRIAKTRVTLDVVIARYQQGATPEQIRDSFPTLNLSDIYAVITYYLQHQTEVDAYLREQDEIAEQRRQDLESEHPELFDLETRLRERIKRD